MTWAIEIRELTKDFPLPLAGKRLRAVDRFSLRIGTGEVYGLLGPNGSGKSTAIKAVLGLSTPTSGECVLMGLPSGESRSRNRVGYLPEAPYFPKFLTAMVGDPELLILDEPTAGVDPEGAADIAAIIAQLKLQGKTILLCSHLLSLVEQVCDRIGIMRRGKLLVEGSVDQLLKSDAGDA